jgi:hypothetical protein
MMVIMVVTRVLTVAANKSNRDSSAQGMDHLHLPTVDFFFAPKVEPMFRGVDYISKHVAAGVSRPRAAPRR